MGIKRFFIAGLAVVASVVVSSTVSAQTTGLSSLARRLEGQANRVGDQVDSVFAHSRLNRSMMRASFDIADAASEIQFLDRTGANRWRMAGEVARIKAEINNLCHLVDQAELRAVRRIDPPICGCIVTLRASIDAMRCTQREMERALESCRVGNGRGAGWDEPVYRPDFGHDHDFGFVPGHRGGGSSLDLRGGSISSGGYRGAIDRPVPRNNAPATLTLTPQGVRFGAVTVDLNSLFNGR